MKKAMTWLIATGAVLGLSGMAAGALAAGGNLRDAALALELTGVQRAGASPGAGRTCTISMDETAP